MKTPGDPLRVGRKVTSNVTINTIQQQKYQKTWPEARIFQMVEYIIPYEFHVFFQTNWFEERIPNTCYLVLRVDILGISGIK